MKGIKLLLSGVAVVLYGIMASLVTTYPSPLATSFGPLAFDQIIALALGLAPVTWLYTELVFKNSTRRVVLELIGKIRDVRLRAVMTTSLIRIAMIVIFWVIGILPTLNDFSDSTIIRNFIPLFLMNSWYILLSITHISMLFKKAQAGELDYLVYAVPVQVLHLEIISLMIGSYMIVGEFASNLRNLHIGIFSMLALGLAVADLCFMLSKVFAVIDFQKAVLDHAFGMRKDAEK